MAENEEKFLSFDKFKERVYKNIGTLESLNEVATLEAKLAANPGCLGFFLSPLFNSVGKYANKKASADLKIKELSEKADTILAGKEIRVLLCEKLDATVVLPIDAAYKITPVLYGLALEDEEKVPFNSMLFAIISRNIVKEGVETFCAKVKTKTEKDHDAKPADD